MSFKPLLKRARFIKTAVTGDDWALKKRVIEYKNVLECLNKYEEFIKKMPDKEIVLVLLQGFKECFRGEKK